MKFLTQPHIIFHDGQFHIYRNKWKSKYRGPRLWASCISAPTLSRSKSRQVLELPLQNLPRV